MLHIIVVALALLQPFHHSAYNPSFMGRCEELVLGLGESLARLRSVLTMTALASVVYLVGDVVVTAPIPFVLLGETWSAHSRTDRRWRRSCRSLCGGIIPLDTFSRPASTVGC
jgi:hypothetical protein